MSKQQTFDDSVEEPDDACFYYGACGNTVPEQSGLSCKSCLGLARHKDKLGAERVGDLMEFLGELYDEYDEPQEVMAALHEDGVEQVVYDVTK